jgi:aminopeptidase N
VTIRTWDDIFMSESAAVWHELGWTEQWKGAEAADEAALTYLEAYLIGVLDEGWFAIGDPDVVFGYTTYMKGALVWRLMEHLAGREELKGVIQQYLNDADGISDNDTFFSLLAGLNNPDLSMFREEWVDRAGLPSYRWGWTFVDNGDQLTLAVRLLQDPNDYYLTPIDVEVSYTDGTSETFTLRPDSSDYTFITCLEGKQPVTAELDPHGWVPRLSVTTVNVDADLSEECGGHSGGCKLESNPIRHSTLPLMPLLGLGILAWRRRQR